MLKKENSKNSGSFNKQQKNKGVKLFLALAFITFMVLPVTAMAEDSTGNKMYVGFNLGMSMPSDSNTTFSDAPFKLNTTVEADSGLATGIVIGRSFNNFRLEGELAYQKNDIKSVTLDSIGYDGINYPVGEKITDVDGDISSTALLVNGYYDFKNSSKFTPFVGAGIGFAKVEVSSAISDSEGLLWTSDSDIVAAAQVSLGANYAITEKVSLDLKYRYFVTADPDFELSSPEYSTSNVYTGIRYSF